MLHDRSGKMCRASSPISQLSLDNSWVRSTGPPATSPLERAARERPFAITHPPARRHISCSPAPFSRADEFQPRAPRLPCIAFRRISARNPDSPRPENAVRFLTRRLERPDLAPRMRKYQDQCLSSPSRGPSSLSRPPPDGSKIARCVSSISPAPRELTGLKAFNCYRR